MTSILYSLEKPYSVDPSKVEVIINLPPPRTIRQLQSLQGKSDFLRRFIVNYAKIKKGFMCFINKDTISMGLNHTTCI